MGTEKEAAGFREFGDEENSDGGGEVVGEGLNHWRGFVGVSRGVEGGARGRVFVRIGGGGDFEMG